MVTVLFETSRYPYISTLRHNWLSNHFPDSEVHGTNMGPIWGRQDPGGPHVGPMRLANCSQRKRGYCNNIGGKTQSSCSTGYMWKLLCYVTDRNWNKWLVIAWTLNLEKLIEALDRLNIDMWSCQFKDSHYKDNTVSRSFDIRSGDLLFGKIVLILKRVLECASVNETSFVQ